MHKKNIGLGAFSIILGVAMYLASFGIRDFAAVGVGATFFPRLASLGFVILGALLILQVLRGPKPLPEAKSPTKRNYSIVLSMVLLVIFLALLESLGYIICSALYIFFQILILAPEKKKNYVLYGIISVISSLATYLLFVRVFQVMIPSGILG
ncbi:tripartite tricarboxylate transporter TctB family protein [Sphaerochaeta sp. PS]|uniref:tripartite tricarboxylate transporter TctB family protein n=1 Tax=Sphaerochaeta sp. PS TaxID=3076336 RepID=UPI0028A56A2F|nr:tripartite tricarboxylate transporter TctB family protein [Sphaerochaeta sp. PS]MDT4763091.1 tripartite tricarboxylate transporter TctB family protein [Sphaerochaeta sp. PS]